MGQYKQNAHSSIIGLNIRQTQDALKY